MGSREAALENLDKAMANWRRPRPWRSPEESRAIKSLAWIWFTCDGPGQTRESIHSVARTLGVSRSYIQKLVRTFRRNPYAMERRVLSTLSSMLQTAKSWSYVCQRVDYANLVLPCDQLRSEARFFTAAELGKIICAAPEPYKTMFTVLAMTGMRAGEMLGLQWPDIEFVRGLIHIRRSAWYGNIQTTKSKTSAAPVPLPEPLASALQRTKSDGDQTRKDFCS
jgi:integrase